MTVIEIAESQLTQTASALPPFADLAPSGRTLDLNWRGVAGATGVRIDQSVVLVDPRSGGSGRNLGVVASAKSNVSSIRVNSPAPGSLLRALRIPAFYRHDGEELRRIRGQSDLGGFRLVLTPIVGGAELAPVTAVPAIGRKKALPAQLVGGSLSGQLFTLPDVVGDSFKITLVDGDAPEDFEAEQISHGDVIWYSAPAPVGLHVDGPDGSELFAIGGPLVGQQRVDVRAALERELGASVATGQATASVAVRSDAVGSASLRWLTTGTIERSIEGRLEVDVGGEPTSIPLPGVHPGRTPRTTVGDVTVRHDGMAIHPISDPRPTADAGISGATVRDVSVVRKLPPEALRGLEITRIGVIGWLLEDSDLTLTVFDTTASQLDLTAPHDRTFPTLIWFDFDEVLPVDSPVEIGLVATRGAFGWIQDPELLVRIAVATTPIGEQVTVGGLRIDLTGPETTVLGASIGGTDGWHVSTDQMCTVSLANAVMEFAP